MNYDTRMLNRCMHLAQQVIEERTGRRVAPRKAMAELLGITRRAPYKWRRIPTERAIQLEREFDGEITAAEMRPDIFGKRAA